MTTILRFDEISDADVDAVIAVWQSAGLTRPWNDPRRDIDFARQGATSTVLVGRLNGEIVSTVMVGHDGHRGAVYYLGVHPGHRRHGYGRITMAAAENWLRERGVWKINLIVRGDNGQAVGFYDSIGYAVEPNLQLTRRLEPPPGET